MDSHEPDSVLIKLVRLYRELKSVTLTLSGCGWGRLLRIQRSVDTFFVEYENKILTGRQKILHS